MVGVDHVDGEVLRPRVAVEAGAEHGAVLGPAVAGVGGRVHAEHAQAPPLARPAAAPPSARADHGVSPMVKSARTRAAASWRSGETSRDVAHDGGGQAGQAGQLAQAGGGLAQHAVHAGRPVDVGGHLRDDQHGRRARRECRAGAAAPPGGRMHGSGRRRSARGARRHDVSDCSGEVRGGRLARLGSATLGESGGRAAHRRLRPAWPGAAAGRPGLPRGVHAGGQPGRPRRRDQGAAGERAGRRRGPGGRPGLLG